MTAYPITPNALETLISSGFALDSVILKGNFGSGFAINLSYNGRSYILVQVSDGTKPRKFRSLDRAVRFLVEDFDIQRTIEVEIHS